MAIEATQPLWLVLQAEACAFNLNEYGFGFFDGHAKLLCCFPENGLFMQMRIKISPQCVPTGLDELKYLALFFGQCSSRCLLLVFNGLVVGCFLCRGHKVHDLGILTFVHGTRAAFSDRKKV